MASGAEGWGGAAGWSGGPECVMPAWFWVEALLCPSPPPPCLPLPLLAANAVVSLPSQFQFASRLLLVSANPASSTNTCSVSVPALLLSVATSLSVTPQQVWGVGCGSRSAWHLPNLIDKLRTHV